MTSNIVKCKEKIGMDFPKTYFCFDKNHIYMMYLVVKYHASTRIQFWRVSGIWPVEADFLARLAMRMQLGSSIAKPRFISYFMYLQKNTKWSIICNKNSRLVRMACEPSQSTNFCMFSIVRCFPCESNGHSFFTTGIKQGIRASSILCSWIYSNPSQSHDVQVDLNWAWWDFQFLIMLQNMILRRFSYYSLLIVSAIQPLKPKGRIHCTTE